MVLSLGLSRSVRNVAALAGAIALCWCGEALAQSGLNPGEMVLGSRRHGTVFGPVREVGTLSPVLSGRDLSVAAGAVRGVGPSLVAPHFALVVLPGGRLIACPSGGAAGRFEIDATTGDRTLLPNTNGPLWVGGGDMLAIDADSFLAIADDFAGGLRSNGRILKHTISTGVTELVSGGTRGDGVVMLIPRSMTWIDSNTIAVVEFGPAGGVAGALVYRVDLQTGNRTVMTSLSRATAARYTVTNGVISTTSAPVLPVGSGPTVERGDRGIMFLGGRLFAGGTAESIGGQFLGGIVEVDLATGNRTLLGGTAFNGTTPITLPFGEGSDPYVSDAPSAFQKLTDHSFVFTETFGPDRVYSFDINTRRVRVVADLTPQVLPSLAPAFFSGLAVNPCGSATPGFVISQQPQPAAACLVLPAAVSVALSTAGPFEYQWQAQRTDGTWVPLSNGQSAEFGIVSGAESGRLSISPPGPVSVRVRVEGACGVLESTAATVSNCLGDADCDSDTDGDDIITYFAAWDVSSPAADANRDGGVDGDDIIAFFGAWDAGC